MVWKFKKKYLLQSCILNSPNVGFPVSAKITFLGAAPAPKNTLLGAAPAPQKYFTRSGSGSSKMEILVAVSINMRIIG